MGQTLCRPSAVLEPTIYSTVYRSIRKLSQDTCIIIFYNCSLFVCFFHYCFLLNEKTRDKKNYVIKNLVIFA